TQESGISLLPPRVWADSFQISPQIQSVLIRALADGLSWPLLAKRFRRNVRRLSNGTDGRVLQLTKHGRISRLRAAQGNNVLLYIYGSHRVTARQTDHTASSPWLYVRAGDRGAVCP